MNNKKIKTLPHPREAGSILPQLLVAAGVIAGLSLGVMNMTRTVSRSQEAMENRFEMSIIEDEIQMALRSRLGCRRSVGGSSVTATPGAQVNSIRDGFGNESDPGRRIISIDDVLGRVVDASGDKNTTAPEFTVTDIRVSTYADEDGAAASEGTTTSYVSGTPETYDYGPAIVSVYFDKGDSTVDSAENEKMQASRSYGVQSFRKDFPIRVLVNSSSEIADCFFDENNIVEQFCESLDGIWSNGLCKEIGIEEDPIGVDEDGIEAVYAINSQASMLVQSQGAVVVGDFDATAEEAGFPEPAHLYLENDADIRGTTEIAGDMTVEGENPAPADDSPEWAASLQGNVGIGSSPVLQAKLLIAGDSLDPKSNPARPGVLVERGSDSVEILNEVDITNDKNESFFIRNQSSNPSLKISLGSTSSGKMIQDAGGQFNINSDGSVEITGPGANYTLSMEIGTSTSGYFRGYIRNQPTSVGTGYQSAYDITGDAGDEIVTKQWAAGSVYAHLTDGSEGVTIGNIVSGYNEHNQLREIREMICDASRNQLHMGTGGNADGPTLTGSWNPTTGRCSFNYRHCDSGSRCGNLFTTGIQSSGEIYTNNQVRVQSGTNKVLLRNNGTVSATNTISSSSLVRAPTIRGTGTSTISGVCASIGCARRFGYYRCPTGTAAVGVSYGQILCGVRNAMYGQGPL